MRIGKLATTPTYSFPYNLTTIQIKNLRIKNYWTKEGVIKILLNNDNIIDIKTESDFYIKLKDL